VEVLAATPAQAERVVEVIFADRHRSESGQGRRPVETTSPPGL
jgi:hypothetical protein